MRFLQKGLLLVGALWLVGCAPKAVETVDVSPYAAKPAAFKKSGTIYVGRFTDTRKNKKIIGYILSDGKVEARLQTQTDFLKWFRQALVGALKKEGCKLAGKRVYNDQIPRIYLHIDKVEARYDRSQLTGENLTTDVRVTLLLFHGSNAKVTKKIGLQEKKWIPPVGASKAIESALQGTLEQVADMVVEQIDAYRF